MTVAVVVFFVLLTLGLVLALWSRWMALWAILAGIVALGEMRNNRPEASGGLFYEKLG